MGEGTGRGGEDHAPPVGLSTTAKIKGTGLTLLVPYVRGRWGDDGVERMRAHPMSAGAAEAVAGAILPGTWYSFRTFVELLDAGTALFGPTFAPGHGRYAADENLRGVYRAFIRLASPGFLIERASKVWHQYYTSGEMKMTSEGRGARGELVGFALPHARHCETVVAWSVRAVELTGATGVRGVHESCRARGDARCLYAYTWG